MRFWSLVLAAVLLWAGMAPEAVCGSDLKRTSDGSLVLGGLDPKGGATDQQDLLHTILSREVQVFILRHTKRVWPRPYVLGQSMLPRSLGTSRNLANPYLEGLIQKYARQHGVDPALVRAVMQHESGFNPYAVSPKGAQGLMQLMPGTAALMGVQNPFDPEQNIAGGVGYLRYCLEQFNHSVPLAVAAYNAGPARVAKSGGIPAIPETQNFVNSVLSSYQKKMPGPTTTSPAPSAKTVTKTVNAKILPPPAKTVAAPIEDQEGSSRPRPKIIEVRYPKRVLAAKPKEAD